ncbi:MAG: hypothetical protein K9M07_03095 [Simkaniaceae bacterium]|nr:hypothetical protein [Simkaniaceae bacterium]MCF7852209.1 hypothetical protein [Simkaniaceae bacterium]
MDLKKIIGIILAVLGISLIFISGYIRGRVEEGKQEISSGQQTVDQTNKLFSITGPTKVVGDELTGSAQQEIDEGRSQVAHYERMASQLQIGGIILIIAGAGLFVYGFMKRR